MKKYGVRAAAPLPNNLLGPLAKIRLGSGDDEEMPRQLVSSGAVPVSALCNARP
ncbi:hypothetical protein OG563_07270 [Nocardia vinacea]|uniref:Uncharacterized protein n=1 Tax=Nocardia vinacea TaxID=96468 RepID=A0ABZ1YXI7_9NOCA|nr:hypothetical protein [Nocardia vinacea]